MSDKPVPSESIVPKKSKPDTVSRKKKSDSKNPTVINPNDNSATYKKNERTGQWEVKNPSGSIAYNYLYRGFYEED